MNNIVCVTTTVSVGGTFVDWSVHFLSGKRKFYSVKNSAWLDLSNNPVQEINAHGHKKNHPGGHDSTWKYIEQLAAQSKTDLLSLYATCLPAWMAAEAQSISSPLDTKKHQQIVAYQKNDLEKLINSLMNAGIKVIYISLNKENILYRCVSRSLDRLYFADKVPASIDERNNHKDQLFFGDSITQWTDRGLTSKWDYRERLALCVRPFDPSQIIENLAFNRCHPYCEIPAPLLWCNGINAMERIMDFLNIPIDKTAWSCWVEIYHTWQQQQFKLFNFVLEFEHIMDAIVNNWYYKIQDLTFEQEVVIQHCLIYRYGLNLKTWQLQKFPSNTQDLHKLLEPNIHPIPKIY